MRCETTRLNLKALHDGELARLDAWRVRRHVEGCARCAEELASLRSLNDLLLLSDIVGRDRSQEAVTAIPVSVPPAQERKHARGPGVSKGARNRTPQLIGGVVTAALAISLVAPSLVNQKKSMAAEVRAALQEVNTWHLSGWKLIDGERVPWEVWGRRKPFFYRERIGQEITLDDGTQRVQTFGSETTPRLASLVLRTASRPVPGNEGSSYARMVQRWRGTVRPWKETPTQALFKFSDGPDFEPGFTRDCLWTVNKRNALPTRYEVRRGNRQATWTAELLSVRYNVPLPPSVAAPPAPERARVIDALGEVTSEDVPRDNIASANGLTVQMTPLAADAEGNVLLRLRGWLGNVRVRPGSPFHLKVYGPADWLRGQTRQSPYHDDQNRPYCDVELVGTPDVLLPDGDRLTLFTPAEPVRKGEVPRMLNLRLTVAPGVWARMPGIKGMGTERLLWAEELSWALPLPQDRAPINIDTYLPPARRAGFQRMIAVHGGSIDGAILEARSHYYGARGYRDSSPEGRANLRRSITLMEQALARYPDNGMAQAKRIILARTYRQLGDKVRAVQLLHEVIAESKRHPEGGDDPNRRQAEKVLRTWARP